MTHVVASGVGAHATDVTSLVSVLKEWVRPGNPTLEEMTQRACQIGRADAVLAIARELEALLGEASTPQKVGARHSRQASEK